MLFFNTFVVIILNSKLKDISKIKEIKKLSKENFEHIFKEYYDKLLAYSMLFVKQKQIAEEIVLDIFTDLWLKRRKIQIRTNLFSYLLIATKNKSISYLRKKKINFYDIEALNFANGTANPEDKIIREEEIEAVYRVLETIPPRSREVFILQRFEGLTYQQISEVLHISKNTVENHMVKALKILREHFNE
jgi:RNA polymerase sigma-70 factor (ECF subfamily)